MPYVMEVQEFSLDTEFAISYDYLLPRPVVVCILAFVLDEHGKIIKKRAEGKVLAVDSGVRLGGRWKNSPPDTEKFHR